MSEPEQNLRDTPVASGPESEPPAAPEDDEIDWGGDGSDLSEPVRAHVLAALRPSAEPYQPPVSELLALGDAREQAIQARRDSLSIGQEQLAELVRMARDRTLHATDGDDPRGWAPIHAGELLRRLDVSAVVDELVPLFDIESDWFTTAVPEALGKAGQPALAPVRAYLADRGRWDFGHSNAIEALREIAERHPELRDEVVEALSDVLRNLDQYGEYARTVAMSNLVALKAVEALPLIRRAFEQGKVDPMMRGTWEMVLKELGLEPEPGDPLIAASQRDYDEQRARLFPPDLEANLAALQASRPGEPAQTAPPAATQRRKQDKARKEKNKRKAEKASRKANRKKRK